MYRIERTVPVLNPILLKRLELIPGRILEATCNFLIASGVVIKIELE